MKKIDTEEPIKTSNLILEPILPSHAAKLFESLQSRELFAYIPHNPPASIIKLEERYARWANRKSDDESEIWLNYAIFSIIYSDYVGTVQATIQSTGNVYLAYEVFPNVWRRGIAKEACNALIDILFCSYEVKIIKAHVDTRNEASFRLLESLGFKRIQTIFEADEFKGSVSDEYVYALTKNSYHR